MCVYVVGGCTEKGKEQKDVCLIDSLTGCVFLKGSFTKERREQKGVYLINCLLCLSKRWSHKEK